MAIKLCLHVRDLDGARCVLNAPRPEDKRPHVHGYAAPAPEQAVLDLVKKLEERDPHALIPRRTAARLIRDAKGWK